jgi:hypothetical protein
MTWVRKLVGIILGFESLSFLPWFPVAVFVLFHNRRISPELNITDYLLGPAGATLVGLCFAWTWWAIRRGSPSARLWALNSSAANVLLALRFISLFEGSLIGASWAMGALGLVGAIAFARKFKTTTRPKVESSTQSLPGDGTSALLNRTVGLVGAAIILSIDQWWVYWRHLQLLPQQPFLIRIAFLVPVVAITIMVHELGHAAGAVATGLKIFSFVLGPFDWRILDGRWAFAISVKGMASAGGSVGVASKEPNESCWLRTCVAAAGPTANLLVGAIAFWLAIEARGSRYEAYWGFFGELATLGISTFILNLIPIRVGGMYSDGARIYQLWAPGFWSDYWRVQAQVSSSIVTGIRPRDYDLGSIERLALRETAPLNLLLCRLYAFEYYFDCSEFAASRHALELAALAANQAEDQLTPEICAEFVCFLAYLTRDADAVKSWWRRLEERRPTQFKWDYWMAHSALHWVGGNLSVANESWEKGNALVQKLPQAGAYEFDRHCFALLRVAIDESALLQNPSAAKAGLPMLA